MKTRIFLLSLSIAAVAGCGTSQADEPAQDGSSIVYKDSTSGKDVTYDDLVKRLTEQGSVQFVNQDGSRNTCFDMLDSEIRSFPDKDFPNGEQLYLEACYEALRAFSKTQKS